MFCLLLLLLEISYPTHFLASHCGAYSPVTHDRYGLHRPRRDYVRLFAVTAGRDDFASGTGVQADRGRSRLEIRHETDEERQEASSQSLPML